MMYSTIAFLFLLAVLVPVAMTIGCRRAGCSPKGEAVSPGDPADAGQGQKHRSPIPASRTNRLADEASLYLLMHAENPVDWCPWGEEALAKAKAEGKLIFLSVGYSSCHWCHVMERESFVDEEVAKFLNEHFVSIKVDREERPDVDEIYMTALQLYFHLIRSPQGGGWPLTMVLTPDAGPVVGGTYFPPRDRDGRTGLLTLLKLAHEAWQNKPAQLRENAALLGKLVQRQLQEQPAATESGLDPGLLDGVLAALIEQFDPEYGGFGYEAANPRMPKFPQPSALVFLLDRARHDRAGRKPGEGANAREAESMLLTTLERMAAGGIRDHLGGGFHRYSTDRFWAIPHFEKMLYDNAQLASVYAEAYELFGREDFRRVAEEILDFVSREMTAPEGGFYAAIDAETDAEEGRYYVWQRDELAELLDTEQLRLLAEVYGIGQQGNFEGRHVLLLPRPLREASTARQWTEEQLWRRLEPVRRKLLEARGRRKHPATDTKLLTAWNGLMIRGFADAGRLFKNDRYIHTAETAAKVVLEKLRNPEGRLLRSFAGGRARLNAYLDDYALLVDGLIALHQATGEDPWLQEADRLTTIQISLFWDDQQGGFFFTSIDHENLIARTKDPNDSALPSGNAVAVANLVYLSQALGKPEYLNRAEKTIRAFVPRMERLPGGMPRMAASLAALLGARG